MASISEMASKGKNKYRSKVNQMKTNYEDSIDDAVQSFKEVGFGSNFTRTYEQSMRNNAVDNYRNSVDEAKADKWARNWERKVSR